MHNCIYILFCPGYSLLEAELNSSMLSAPVGKKIHNGYLMLPVVVLRPKLEVHASSSPTHITTPWQPHITSMA